MMFLHLWESLVVKKIGIRIAREFREVICQRIENVVLAFIFAA